MEVDQQRAFQEAFARLCVDAALRRRWRSDRAEVIEALHLSKYPRVVAVLQTLEPDAIDALAANLFERRWSHVARTVPATASVWPTLREVCRAHESAGDEDASIDGEAQSRRSPGLRTLLRVRRPVHAALEKGGGAPPWLGDLFSFELECALAREEGALRELSCAWPAHEIATSCVRGETAPAWTPGAFHYRMVADRLFVRGH